MEISICLLAMLKLMDIEAFGTSHKKYYLITSLIDTWIFTYPFCDLIIVISFLTSYPPSLIIFIVLILVISGMPSIFNAVQLDKFKLKLFMYRCICKYSFGNYYFYRKSFNGNYECL